MTVIGVGDLQMANGENFSGLVIQATRGELQAVAGNVLYKEVEIVPYEEHKNGGCEWTEEMDAFVKRLCNVDLRVRTAKTSRKYSRDEVLAMLDEIDPVKDKKGGAE